MEIIKLPPCENVKAMLLAADLPVSDLDSAPAGGERLFFGIEDGDHLNGIVGLEMFKSCSLLRSLAVTKNTLRYKKRLNSDFCVPRRRL